MPQSSTTRIMIALVVGATVACAPGAGARRGGAASATVASDVALTALGAASTSVDSASLASRYPQSRPRWAPTPRPAGELAPFGLPAALRDSLPPRVLQRVLHSVRGEATFYADILDGKQTASGIPFSQNEMVAAHRAFPFGTLLRVTNTRNDRSIHVRVVDRGPWGARAAARNTIIDLSKRAARQLGYLRQGRAPVKIEVLEWGPGADGPA